MYIPAGVSHVHQKGYHQFLDQTLATEAVRHHLLAGHTGEVDVVGPILALGRIQFDVDRTCRSFLVEDKTSCMDALGILFSEVSFGKNGILDCDRIHVHGRNLDRVGVAICPSPSGIYHVRLDLEGESNANIAWKSKIKTIKKSFTFFVKKNFFDFVV